MTVVAGIEHDDPVLIQSSVLVYLVWSPSLRRWEVDPSTVDGDPLDVPTARMTSTHGQYSQLDPHHQDDWDMAENAQVPTGVHLAHMMLDAAEMDHHEVGHSYRKFLTDKVAGHNR